MERKISKAILSSFIILLLVVLLQVNSNAATTGKFYFNAINNSNSQAISDLGVAVYQVGIQTEEGNFMLSEGFEGYTLDLTEDNIESLKTYAKENAQPTYVKTTDSNGNFTLTDVKVGVYLFVQESKTEEYTMQTMLVKIPETKTSGTELIYDVTVKPKIVSIESIPNVVTPQPVTDSTLPYTGVLNWPVPVLVILGIAIFCVGWLKFYTDSKKKVN